MFHPHELAPKRFVTVTELDVMEMTKLLEMRKKIRLSKNVTHKTETFEN